MSVFLTTTALLLRLMVTIAIAFFVGKLVSRIKLPSILGWLITGMILGPHAFNLMNDALLNAQWYQIAIHILECAVGLLIGTELVWKRIKKSGAQIMITTLTQSLGTFFLVSLVFGIIFYFMDIPLYLSVIFGGIALATAPAPALSVVREFMTDGPVTKTLIPMAALDDIVGVVVFFSVISIVASKLSGGGMPAYMIALIVVLPLLIGVATGLLGGFLLKKERKPGPTIAILSLMLVLTSVVGFFFNSLMPKPVLNFMLMGMAFSATFSNIVSEKRLEQIMNSFNPILGVAMIIVILNLGAPLDYHLIAQAGVFTAVYIIARAIGKYFGAYFGASVTKSPKTVKKFLGLTLLPHSGVSLVFTGIAVSVLSGADSESAKIIQGTIAAAAVINEVIAVIVAKKGFEWAGEFNKQSAEITQETETRPGTIIAISRQYGSGGREIGKKVAEALNIPFYDNEIIEMAAKQGDIDIAHFEDNETKGVGSLLYDLSVQGKQSLSINDRIFIEQSKVITELAEKGSCVIVGRCADYVLRNRKNVLKVFIYAGLEERKNRIEHIYKELSGKALDKIQKTDKKRASYYTYYTKQKFGDAENYDICLNSGAVGIEECAEMVKAAYLVNEEHREMKA